MDLINKIKVSVILLALSLTASAQSGASEKAPDIVLKDLKGKTIRLKDFRGRVVLLNFWATWCVPCRAEIPELVKWQKEYQAQGLQIIGVTYPPVNKIKVRKFARQNKINYPVLFGTKKTKALFDAGDVMPYSIVIDKDGNIKARIEGVIFDDEFDEKIKPLIEGEGIGFKPFVEPADFSLNL
jgi:thiol-disulfide isomerase/thioredoxin